MAHLISISDLRDVYNLLGVPSELGEQKADELATTSEELACGALRSTSIGRAAIDATLVDGACWDSSADGAAAYGEEDRCCFAKVRDDVIDCWVGGRSREKCCPPACLAILVALGSFPQELDLRLPWAAHDFRRAMRHDRKIRDRFRRKLVGQVLPAIGTRGQTVLLSSDRYRELRHLASSPGVNPSAEVEFLRQVQTWKIATPLEPERCVQIGPFLQRHEGRLAEQARVVRQLGYTSMDMLVRLGEEGFVQLADCLLPEGGYIATIDYGATFTSLLHSSSVSGEDNIVPPMYEIPEGSTMPDCHTEWSRCAGLIDWTTFIDFTNLAVKGAELGWEPVFYGPQSALEQITPMHLSTSGGDRLTVPGYFVLEKAGHPNKRSFLGRTVRDWYGRSFTGQRWASFKLLVQHKSPSNAFGRLASSCTGGTLDTSHCSSPIMAYISAGRAVLSGPSFPLSAEDIDPCWSLDATQIPLADRMRIDKKRGRPPWHVIGEVQANEFILEQLDQVYGEAYEDAQLTARIVDHLVASHGCDAVVKLEHGNLSAVLSGGGRWGKLWEPYWGRKRVRRVLEVTIRQAARHNEGPLARGEVVECEARKAARKLCASGLAPPFELLLKTQQ